MYVLNFFPITSIISRTLTPCFISFSVSFSFHSRAMSSTPAGPPSVDKVDGFTRKSVRRARQRRAQSSSQFRSQDKPIELTPLPLLKGTQRTFWNFPSPPYGHMRARLFYPQRVGHMQVLSCCWRLVNTRTSDQYQNMEHILSHILLSQFNGWILQHYEMVTIKTCIMATLTNYKWSWCLLLSGSLTSIWNSVALCMHLVWIIGHNIPLLKWRDVCYIWIIFLFTSKHWKECWLSCVFCLVFGSNIMFLTLGKSICLENVNI